MTKGYRPASSYLGTGEARQAQLNNLLQGRAKRARKALVKPPSLKDPAYKTDIIKFAEEQFYIPETRKPIVLEDFQKEKILKPIFYGEDRPTMALVGQTKKSGKSTLAALAAAWQLFCGEDFSEIYIAARDKEQSQWVTFNKLVKTCELNHNMLINVDITKDSIERKATGSIVRCLPVEVSCAGLNPSLVIFDELWSYDLESMTRFFEEMTTVPTRKNPLVLIVSYAGYDTDEENLLYSLYQKGQKGGDPTFFFYWDHKNSMPWQTKKYLKQQKGRLRKNTYLRLHNNIWTSGQSQFIDEQDLKACTDRKHKPLLPDKSLEVVIGVDASVKGDSSAVVVTTKKENQIILVCHKKWQPTKKQPLDLEETIEAYIKELSENYAVQEVLYDPFQLHSVMTRLNKDGINCVEYPQTVDRLIAASQNLYDLFKNKNIILYPDSEVKSHILKSTAKEHPRGFRIVKEKQSIKIDICVALAMSAFAATKMDTDNECSFFTVDMNAPVTQKKPVKKAEKKKEKKTEVKEKIENAAERNKRIWNTPEAWTRG